MVSFFSENGTLVVGVVACCTRLLLLRGALICVTVSATQRFAAL